MAVQGTLNASLSKVIGLLEAAFAVHVIGAVFGGVLLLLGLGTGHFADAADAPWYTYLGGVLGMGIVFAVAFAIGKAGAASATTAIIVGQVTTAVIIDLFGWLGVEQIPFSFYKPLGLALMAGGAWLMLYRPT